MTPCIYVSCSGSITTVEEEKARLSAIVYLLLCVSCSERFPLPLGALDGLWHSQSLRYNYYEQIQQRGVVRSPKTSEIVIVETSTFSYVPALQGSEIFGKFHVTTKSSDAQFYMIH